MPYVITKINGKKFAMGHRGSESAVFTKEEVERVAATDCVIATNLVTRGTEKFGCAKRKRKSATRRSQDTLIKAELDRLTWYSPKRGTRGVGSCRCKKR